MDQFLIQNFKQVVANGLVIDYVHHVYFCSYFRLQSVIKKQTQIYHHEYCCVQFVVLTTTKAFPYLIVDIIGI